MHSQDVNADVNARKDAQELQVEDILTPQTLYDLRYGYTEELPIEELPVAETSGQNKTFASLDPNEQLEQLERFKGICALYGYESFAALQRSHVVILGNGGVGSWIAESLCRSGVGNITLVDFDTIELSNSNRQLHTLSSTLHQNKASVLGQRLLDINPFLNLRTFNCQLTKAMIYEQLAAILQLTPQELQQRQVPNLNEIENPLKIARMMRESAHPLYVAEAIDDLPAKTRCVDILHRARIPVITSGGAGGRINPSHLQVGDIAQAQGDQLIKRLRTELRREFNYPRGQINQPFNICCTYSDETPQHAKDFSDADKAALQQLGLDESLFDSLPALPKFGASMSVTASAGLLISSVIVRWICAK